MGKEGKWDGEEEEGIKKRVREEEGERGGGANLTFNECWAFASH